jgi:hypothetical protein
MNNAEKFLFADVDLPFHVWVKEGRRWVLRDAGAELESRQASRVSEPPLSSAHSAERSSRS